MDIETQETIDRLTREFIDEARKQGVEVQHIKVEWTNGRFDAKVAYSPHIPRIPAKDSYHGEPQAELG